MSLDPVYLKQRNNTICDKFRRKGTTILKMDADTNPALDSVYWHVAHRPI
jgi:hypothetical protein